MIQVPQSGGVKPVFSQVLRFKTKKFPTPMRLQYLGLSNGSCSFSDGVHSMPVKVGRSYQRSFADGTFKPLTVFSILECNRGPIPCDLFFSNLLVVPKQEQIGFVIGKPVPYAV